MSKIIELVNGNALEHGISMFLDHGGPSGSQMHVGGQAATKTAATTLTNSTTQTLLDSCAIPANSLVAGSTIRVKSMGIATATNSTDTLQITLGLGPTATALASREEILATDAVDAVNNDVFYIDAVIQVRTVGTGGTAVAMVQYQDPDAVATTSKRILKASFTLNTTVANTLAVSGQWSVANAGNSMRSDLFVVDIVNPST